MYFPSSSHFRKTLTAGLGSLILCSFTSPVALAGRDDSEDSLTRTAGVKRPQPESGRDSGRGDKDKRGAQGESPLRHPAAAAAVPPEEGSPGSAKDEKVLRLLRSHGTSLERLLHPSLSEPDLLTIATYWRHQHDDREALGKASELFSYLITDPSHSDLVRAEAYRGWGKLFARQGERQDAEILLRASLSLVRENPLALAMRDDMTDDSSMRTAGVKRIQPESGCETGRGDKDKRAAQGENPLRHPAAAAAVPSEEGSPGSAKDEEALDLLRRHGHSLETLLREDLHGSSLLKVATYWRHQFGNLDSLGKAINLFRYLTENPSCDGSVKAQAYRGWGKLLDRQGNRREAEEHLRASVRIAPENLNSLFTLADFLTYRGSNPQDVLDLYEKVITQAEIQGLLLWKAKAHIGLGNARAGRDRGISYYEAALEATRNPDLRAQALIGLGNARAGQHHYEEALRATQDPDLRAQAHIGLGNARAGRDRGVGHYAEALEATQDPDLRAQAYIGLGNARAGDRIGHYEEALKVKPNPGLQAKCHLGLGRSCGGQKALDHYRMALELPLEEKDREAATKGIEYIKQKLGKEDASRHIAEQTASDPQRDRERREGGGAAGASRRPSSSYDNPRREDSRDFRDERGGQVSGGFSRERR